MEFKLVYNEVRTDPDIKYDHQHSEEGLRENFVRVEVYSAEDYRTPSLIKVSHGYNQVEDWTTRWVFASFSRENAIRHAIRILDGYALGLLCSDMVKWDAPEDKG